MSEIADFTAELRELAAVYVRCEKFGFDDLCDKTLIAAKRTIDEMGVGFVNTKLFLMGYAPDKDKGHARPDVFRLAAQSSARWERAIRRRK